MVKKRIGELLVDSGVVSSSDINLALSNKAIGQKLGDYLVAQGLVKEETLYENLRNQLQLSLFKLTEVTFSPEVLDIGDYNLLLDCVAFPVELSGSLLTVAMADPLDVGSVSRLEDELGYEILPALGLKSEILDHIDMYFALNDTMESVFNVTGVSLNDKSEAQILDHISGFLKEKGRLHFVLGELKTRVRVLHGDCGLDNSRELKTLLKILDHIVGIEVGRTSSSTFVSSEGNKVRVTVDSVSRGEVTEYWITLSEIRDEIVTEDSLGLKNVDRGFCVVTLDDFSKVDELLFKIVGEFGVGEVLSYGGRSSLLDYGIRYVDRSNISYESVVDMSDVFLVEDVWSEEGRIEALKLVMAGKLVISIVPRGSYYDFKDMFIGKSSVDRALYTALRVLIEYEG